MSNKRRLKTQSDMSIKPVDYSENAGKVDMTGDEKKVVEIGTGVGVVAESGIELQKTEWLKIKPACGNSVKIENCTDKTDITKGDRVPSGFLLETEKPKRCTVTIRLTSGTNYQMVMHTLINDNNYIGHPLEKKVCTTKLIPMEFTKIINCDAKIHIFYSAIN